jgi:hypothetical protein
MHGAGKYLFGDGSSLQGRFEAGLFVSGRLEDKKQALVIECDRFVAS